MRNSSNKNGFTMVDHVTLDIVRPTLTSFEFNVYITIYRQTVGWKKPTDRISLSQFRRTTGIKDNGTIIKAIKGLESKGLIRVKRTATRTNIYSIISLTELE